MVAQIDAGGPAYVLDDGELVRIVDGQRETICADRDIAITLGGARAAPHACVPRSRRRQETSG